MEIIADFGYAVAENWPIWVVTITLIVAAVIDGFELRVPNWLTYPMIVTGWIYSGIAFGWEGIGWSLAGTIAGLLCLLPFYLIGGMGAGDVKLMAGVGAWVYCVHTFWGFAVTVIVGMLLAIAMVLVSGKWQKHSTQFFAIFYEIISIRDADKLSEIAAARKPTMMLLPYGIPIAIGVIGYFAWTGMLV